MADGTLQIITPDLYKQWQAGLKQDGLSQAAIDMWEDAVAIVYEKTQAAAHVDTGAMKSSGKLEKGGVQGTTVTTSLVYTGGAGGRDYAMYEAKAHGHAGGQHDFLSRGIRAAMSPMAAAFGKAVAADILSKVKAK